MSFNYSMFNDDKPIYIAGPCSIESKEHIFEMARLVKEAGANFLRGGAFKPRTSIESFQGVGERALEWLVEAGRANALPVVSEIVDVRKLNLYKDVDIIQVGARNMQNFELLKELGKLDKWILLKRGFGATANELLKASEYITKMGNDKVILCERGIRTFENSTRFTLDLNSLALIKKESDLKIIVDPSHAAGISNIVKDLALAGIGAGADGWIIECHKNPNMALSDKEQAIKVGELKEIIDKSNRIKDIIEG